MCASLRKAVQRNHLGAAFAIFHNLVQACLAGSRLILHVHSADAFLDPFCRPGAFGMLWINAYERVCPGSPFGQSGYGREMGFEAMREYTTVKSVRVDVDAEIPPFIPR
jgi:acyl-CoA reductase-like NAD-dependent aldehyde dehydrogenase